MQSPPQAGEIWVNIHSKTKVTIHSVEKIAMAKGGYVVVYDEEKWKRNRCDVMTFNANWKRHKSRNIWFLGAFN